MSIIFFVFVVCLSTSLGAPAVKSKQICSTKNCTSLAAKLKRYMNSSVDPCEDFYEFACGSWLKSTEQSQPISTVDDTSLLQRKIDSITNGLLENTVLDSNTPRSVKLVITAYKSCVEYDDDNSTAETMKSFFSKEIGGFPLVEGKAWRERDYREITAKLSGKFFMDILISLYVDRDPKNSSLSLIQLLMPKTSEYFKNATLKFDCLVEFARTWGNEDEVQVRNDLQNLLLFMEKLSQVRDIAEEPPTSYNKLTLSELQSKIPSINWIHYLRMVVGVHVKSPKKIIRPSTNVLLYNEEYFQKLGSLLASGEFSNRTIVDYTSMILCSEDCFSCLFDDEETNSTEGSDDTEGDNDVEVDDKVVEAIAVNATKEDCSMSIAKQMPYAVDFLYLQEHNFDFSRVFDMIGYVRQAYKELLEEADWIQPTAKLKLISKINSMRFRIAFPSWMLSGKELDEYYKQLPDLTSNKIQNEIEINKFTASKHFERLENMPPGHKWLPEVNLKEVNAFHLPEGSTVVFPIAILKSPFYDDTFPMYLNFGATGVAMGHEITHGFDSIGRLYDGFGHLNTNWLPADFSEKVEERTQCIIQQYNKFEYNGHKGNGTLTQDEDVADCGGIRQAFRAYKNWVKDNGPEKRLSGLEKFSPEQLFFIFYTLSWCTWYTDDYLQEILNYDVHSPAPARVWGPMSNMKEFAEAFECPEGSRMNPKDKCVLW